MAPDEKTHSYFDKNYFTKSNTDFSISKKGIFKSNYSKLNFSNIELISIFSCSSNLNRFFCSLDHLESYEDLKYLVLDLRKWEHEDSILGNRLILLADEESYNKSPCFLYASSFITRFTPLDI